MRASTATRLMLGFFAISRSISGRDHRVVRRVHAEQVFEALVVDLGRGGLRRDHRHAVFLGDGAHRLGGARAERREQRIDLVLGDHQLGRLHGARRVRLIVGVADLDLVGVCAGLDAAGLFWVLAQRS